MLEPHLLNVGISNRFAAKDVCGHHSRLHQSDATCETSPICAGMGANRESTSGGRSTSSSFPGAARSNSGCRSGMGLGEGEGLARP